MQQKRFIADKTFIDTESGIEYSQGAIYEVDDKTRPLLEQWKAEGKVRDPDVPRDDEGDEAANDPDEDDDDDESDDEPA